MNDCPRQNPAYRLTQFFPLPPPLSPTLLFLHALLAFSDVDQISFIHYFNYLFASLKNRFQSLRDLARLSFDCLSVGK